jgi:Class III cytochrome C family
MTRKDRRHAQDRMKKAGIPARAHRMSRMTGIALLIWPAFVLLSVPGRADPAAGKDDCQCPCPCPEEEVSEPSPDSEACPGTFVLDQLVEVYEEVSFSHRDHAEAAEEGCRTCHHHSSVGVYKKCGACHQKGLFDEGKLNVLNLKAAYHVQCVGCHEESGSGPTGCTECHEIRQ